MINSASIGIPAKYRKAIKEVYSDSDGYWVHLNEGYISKDTECGTIREDNQRDLLHALKWIEKEPC